MICPHCGRTLQRRKPNRQPDRNAKIATAYNRGDVTYELLGFEYGISKTRVKQIVDRFNRSERNHGK